MIANSLPKRSSSAPFRLPEPSNYAKTPLLLRLQRNQFINTTVKHLRLHHLADRILGLCPIRKQTQGGFSYQLRSIASIVAAKEMFETDMYRKPLRNEPVRRFVDLGCNVGFFPILLAEITRSRELEGIMIDGNRTVLKEAQEHATTNGLHRIEGILGLAGFSATREHAEFLINPSSHIASTATGRMNPSVPSAGRSVKVTVPCINVEEAWKTRFGDTPIDLLKVDIEGMELELFRNAHDLILRTSRLIFEWHKWQVSFADCSDVLTSAGFEEPTPVWEDAQHGMAFCRRRAA